jgi:hypothetical protein
VLLVFSRLEIVLPALPALISCISGGASGATKVCSLRALRCLFAFGCETELSEERGRCLRLLLRVDAAGGTAFAGGENMVLVG